MTTDNKVQVSQNVAILVDGNNIERSMDGAFKLKNAMIKIRKAGLAHPFYWSSITYAGR